MEDLMPLHEGAAADAGRMTATKADMPVAQRIAPWWHTLAILLAFAILAVLGRHRVGGYAGSPHPVLYVTQMLTSWMLFGAVVAGVYRRGDFFTSTLRNRAGSWIVEARRGVSIYLGFMAAGLVMVFVLLAGVMAYRTLHHRMTPASSASTMTNGNNSSAQAAASSGRPSDFTEPLNYSRYGFNSETVAAIAPRTFTELLLWVLLSCTAGFVEEHIFRGYILQQALAAFAHTQLSPWLLRASAVAISALLFGSLHLYEGVGGAVIITLLGATYAAITLRFGNLRAVIVAHFLQDFVAGLMLYLLHSRVAG